MRIYADSSALLKIYVQEPGSELVTRSLAQARELAACRVAQTEVAARLLHEPEPEPLLRRFADLWKAVNVVEVDDRLCRSAAQLAFSRNLRTLDALHLAAAVAVADDDLVLATWDRRLWDAARAAGIAVLPDARP